MSKTSATAKAIADAAFWERAYELFRKVQEEVTAAARAAADEDEGDRRLHHWGYGVGGQEDQAAGGRRAGQ